MWGLRHREQMSKNWREETQMKRMLSVWAVVVVIAGAAATAGVAGQTRGTAKPATPATAPPAKTAAAPAAQRSPGAGPVIVFETVKGTFEMETYPNEAPKSVEHILTLVKRNFYNGLRVHRMVPGFVLQFGDPQTRDMTKLADWGTRGSGKAIGVAEISPKRPHKLGAVALAHAGDPRQGDSQMYICINADPGRYSQIDGDFTVFAQVISGIDVVRQLQEKDVIRRATVRAK
jgi:peptidyl-prolyl cis-trans isomerase B (cyclophilin B)